MSDSGNSVDAETKLFAIKEADRGRNQAVGWDFDGDRSVGIDPDWIGRLSRFQVVCKQGLGGWRY